jgi:oxygen-independent coproporphyrinogen-3 oxidase
MSTTDMTRADVAAFIEREFSRPQSNKVLHTHPSPMYWRANDGKTRQRWEKRAHLAKQRRFKDNLYLGIPFCIPTDPAHCGFCLFPTQDYRGKSQISDYLDYLEREAELYGDMLSGDTLASLYVGGGTPNLLRDGEYERLMAIVRKLYGDVAPRIEKTLEGIPQLFTRDKVDAIRSAGFTRVSMGVQQLSDRRLR